MELAPNIVQILWRGRLLCGNLVVKWEARPAEKPPELFRAEQLFWNSLLQANPEKHLFNGALAQLDGFSFDSAALTLRLSATDYRAFLYHQSQREKSQPASGEGFGSQALGISAVVRTSDGFLVLMKRSDRVGEYPNCLDVFGGHIDPIAHQTKGKPDPCKAIGAELEEELGVHAEEIAPVKVFGLIRNLENGKPELIFAAPLSLNSDELADRAKNAADRFEFSELLFLPDQKASLASFLKNHTHDFSPSGFGSLLLYLSGGPI